MDQCHESRKQFQFVWGLILVSTLSWASPEGKPTQKSLEECFQAALVRSEVVAVQGEAVIQAEEKKAQASGTLFPNVSASASYLQQQAPQNATGSSIFPASQSTAKLTAVQPLFRGFREFAAIRQQEHLLGSQKFALKKAEAQLFNDVAQSFYTVISLERDILDFQEEIDVNQKRFHELQNFQKIGRSRATEVLSVQSNLASLEAQLAASEGQLGGARTTFAFLTGFPAETPLADTVTLPTPIPSLDSFLQKIDTRPDVQQQLQALAAAEEGVSIAQGGHLPSIDAIANYYLTRPGVLSSVSWDVQLALTFPLFAGGTIQSQVRQAASVEKQNELALSQARRTGDQEIRNAYLALTTDQSQILKLHHAVNLSFENYRAQLHDYRLGLVTNLDVLQAITNAEEARRLLDRANYQSKLDYFKLQNASGLLTKLDLVHQE